MVYEYAVEVARTAWARVKAGARHRAPDGTVDGVRLFDAFRGPHWTLLGAQAPELGDGVRTVRGPAPEPYGTGLFLVRPDGYVGWAGDSPETLTGYLARLDLGR